MSEETAASPPVAAPAAESETPASEPAKSPSPKPTPTAETPSTEEPLPFGSWLKSSTSWGTSLVQAAKDRTLSTIELVKKDINEFSDTVTAEATAIASATSDAVKQQAQLFHQFVTTPDGEDAEPGAPDFRTEEEKKEFADLEASKANKVPTSASGFNFGWVKQLATTVQNLTIEDTTKDEHLITERVEVGPIRKSILDQYEYSQIQNDERTFRNAPDAKYAEDFDVFTKLFKLSEYDGEINTLLGNNPRLREFYATVVPTELDNLTFWERYFFKVHQAEQEKLVRQQLNVSINSSNKKEKKKSPEGSDKDETWSMCSSTVDNLNEIPDNVSDPEQPTGPLTPRATDDAGEDWEKFDDTTKAKSTSDA
uniref:BSD domain-containing protein n=1 Tax=Panagrellus redivivus TaxID=6233 RepID=A0A7E4UVF5_PANRE